MSDQVGIEVTAPAAAIEVEGVVVVGPSPFGDHNHEHGELTGLTDPDHPIAAVQGLQAALDGKEAAGTAASAVSAHAAASDPHTGYQRESEKAAANGYASLDATTKVPFAQLPTGTGGTQVAIGSHTHTGGGVTDHGALTGLTDPDHPIAAVTGLQTALDGKVPASIVDAKGDLIVASAADTLTRLPVGTTAGHALVVDPAVPSGMKWAAVSGSGGAGAFGNVFTNAESTVATAPSPPTSGTDIWVQAGEGAKFPKVPFNAVVWPSGAAPTRSNVEIVVVTARSTDGLTVKRAQESTAARSIAVGDQIAAGLTARTLEEAKISRLYAPPPAASGLWPIGVYDSQPMAPVVNRLYWVNFKLDDPATFNAYTFYVTGAAGAGGTARVYIANSGGGYATGLLAGTEVSGISTTTTGTKTGNFAAPVVVPAGDYWLSIVFNTSPPTGVERFQPINEIVGPGTYAFNVRPNEARVLYNENVTSGNPTWNFTASETYGVRLAIVRSA